MSSACISAGNIEQETSVKIKEDNRKFDKECNQQWE
jgi:hypothetical protein